MRARSAPGWHDEYEMNEMSSQSFRCMSQDGLDDSGVEGMMDNDISDPDSPATDVSDETSYHVPAIATAPSWTACFFTRGESCNGTTLASQTLGRPSPRSP